MTSKVVYIGDLRTSSVHLKSGSEIVSDAPVDNNGKGEAFSPTDLMANSLASCMLTIMGIKAQSMEVDIKGTTASVTKHMQAAPRMISKIEVHVEIPLSVDEKTKSILQNAAMTCPVFLSLNTEIEKNITFNWT